MSKAGGVLIFCLAVLAAPLVYVSWIKPRPTGVETMNLFPARWTEVARIPLTHEEEFQNQTTWLGGGKLQPQLRHRFRVFLTGKFAASQEGVRFFVMDMRNFERLQDGYPPFFLYTATAAGSIETQVPLAVYVYGLMRVPETQGAVLPSSLPEVLLALLKATQPVPPVRASLDLEEVFECYCTEVEARRWKEAFER